MQKSYSKRMRVTKNGKIVRRQMAQDHFRAKRSGKQTRNKRKGVTFAAGNMRVFRKHF